VALLLQLSNAEGPLVDNVALIDVLQATKTACADIEAKHERCALNPCRARAGADSARRHRDVVFGNL
jgi:hypothetical protein